jgi:outer membrane protein assembly factor BamA
MQTIAPRLLLLAASALIGAAPLALPPRPAFAANSTDSKMFTLSKVTFEGNSRVSTDTLNSVAGLSPGQKVNRQSIVDAFNNVVAEYKKENVGGSIQPEMVTKGSHMTVIFKITEEAPAKTVVIKPVVDHETFTGNKKISSDKLAPALTIKPGSEVTRDTVVADLTALSAVYKAAGIGATITPRVTNLPGGHLDLNFEIVEHK